MCVFVYLALSPSLTISLQFSEKNLFASFVSFILINFLLVRPRLYTPVHYFVSRHPALLPFSLESSVVLRPAAESDVVGRWSVPQVRTVSAAAAEFSVRAGRRVLLIVIVVFAFVDVVGLGRRRLVRLRAHVHGRRLRLRPDGAQRLSARRRRRRMCRSLLQSQGASRYGMSYKGSHRIFRWGETEGSN